MTTRTIRPDLSWLVACIVMTQLADLVTFIPAIARTGIGAESNPLARELFLHASYAGPALAKVASILLLILLVRRIALRFPRLAAPALCLIVGIGIVGAGSNVLGLLG